MYKSTKSVLFFSVFIFMMGSSLKSYAQTPDLVGKTSAKEVREQHRIFDIYTKRYEPNSESLEYLSEIQDSVSIYVIFGTWCHDSKKQIPAFMKTMELADNSNIEVEYFAVSRKKKEPKDIIERWDLKLTPTFIIYKNGTEYGRIVEEPRLSLEQDLVLILKSETISDQ